MRTPWNPLLQQHGAEKEKRPLLFPSASTEIFKLWY